MTTSPYVAISTAPDTETANDIANALVQGGLAACVQLVPIQSIYRWEGSVQTDSEQQLVIKTARRHIDTIEQLLRDRHPYEVAELIAWPIEAGSQAYLDWMTSVINP